MGKKQNKFIYKTPPMFLPTVPEVRIESATSVENAEQTDVLVGGPSFFFYGVEVKNLKSINKFFIRQFIEITETYLYMDGFNKVELRWWNYNNPKFEKLFPEQNDASEKRRVLIGPGSVKNLVIAYRHVDKKSAFHLFSIDSDVGDNFWEMQDYDPVYPPLSGRIEMHTTSGIIDIKINITETKENHLVISEKK